MATVKRVGFDEILQAIQDKLVSDGVVGSRDQVIWVAEDPPHVKGQLDILLRQGKETPANLGGGRYGGWDVAFVDVFIRTQYTQDPSGTNRLWLIKHNQTRLRVKSSLSLYFPEDEDGNVLTAYPFHLRGWLSPERKKHDKSWGDGVGTLEIAYQPDITLPGNA